MQQMRIVRGIKMKYVLMLFLLICTIFDIRTKKIPAVLIWSGILVMAMYRIFLLETGNDSVADFVRSVMPGLLLYFFSRISNQVGSGDGLLIIATGSFFTWKEHLGMLLAAFVMAAVFSGGLLVLKHEAVNRKIPFVPFLFAASGMALCL